MNAIPSRIQRKRTKGYKLPPNTTCVTRPGKYGNPFIIGHWYMGSDHRGVTGLPEIMNAHGWSKIENAQQAVDRFRHYIETEGARSINSDVNKLAIGLKGRNVACWCKEGDPCHGDVWIEYSEELVKRVGGAV